VEIRGANHSSSLHQKPSNPSNPKATPNPHLGVRRSVELDDGDLGDEARGSASPQFAPATGRIPAFKCEA
jgi:hypothetical protein